MSDKHYEICSRLKIDVTKELIHFVVQNKILHDANVFEAMLILRMAEIPIDIVKQLLL